MRLLKADNVYTYREGTQPLHETSMLGLIPDSITVEGENRQHHKKERTGHSHFFTTDEGPREIAANTAPALHYIIHSTVPLRVLDCSIYITTIYIIASTYTISDYIKRRLYLIVYIITA